MKTFEGIDWFRLVACLLVIACHTAPLIDLSPNINFLIMHGISRIAVPFFFMTSGFFLITHYSENEEPLYKFNKRTLYIYFICILLYLPLSIYNGTLTKTTTLAQILQDILFDGTMYHLWYLPASIIGSTIAWFLVRKTNYITAFSITLILFLIGVGGDAWYGLFSHISFIKAFYSFLFSFFTTMRNGIFYAPIYFICGGWIHEKYETKHFKTKPYFVLFLFLMLLECILLHKYYPPKTDAIYLFALPTTFLLFPYLLKIHCPISKKIRTMSAIAYFIHPAMIVLLRCISKRISLDFVKIHLLFYILVTISSLAIGYIYATLIPHKKKRNISRATLSIDKNALLHNVKELKKIMPPSSEMMAVIKADAYGHNAFLISTTLEKNGIHAFAVATIDEAIALRNYGIRSMILILGYTDPNRANELHKFHLTQTIIDEAYAHELQQQNYKLDVHIALDTGMHRIGIPYDDQDAMYEVFQMKNLNVTGIFTHLCVANSLKQEDIVFTNLQIKRFNNATKNINTKNIKRHVQSSAGLLNYPYLQYDYVRVGISLYGITSANEQTISRPNLKPVLTLQAEIVSLRKIKKGETIGYGRTYTCPKDAIIAVIPIGYADGIPRMLSNHSSILQLNGKQISIVGRICMDQMMIDVTNIPDVHVHDIVTIFSPTQPVEKLSQETNTISNEFVSRLGKRYQIRSYSYL